MVRIFTFCNNQNKKKKTLFSLSYDAKVWLAPSELVAEESTGLEEAGERHGGVENCSQQYTC